MRYISTRGQAPPVSFLDAVLAGMAPDGGLYVPEEWPTLSPLTKRASPGSAYQEAAASTLVALGGNDISATAAADLVARAYGGQWDGDVAPLIEEGVRSGRWTLELFHGPSLSFKDVAMQLIGALYDRFLQSTERRLTVLCATSGDTGGAAVEALKGLSRVDLFVLLPKGRISDVQRRFMTTAGAANLFPVEVDSDFDACQALVKQLFADYAFAWRASLSAVNSINWARILAQSIYYRVAADALGERSNVSFVVPTGNFGNAYSGFVAKQMGARIGKIMVATNANDILARALRRGRYERRATAIATLSPAMDIQVASNFERILFEALGRDGENVAALYGSFADEGGFDIPADARAFLNDHFESSSVGDVETQENIAAEYFVNGFLFDPHTAVARGARSAFSKDVLLGDQVVTVATAHPAKFPDTVEAATSRDGWAGERPLLPSRCADLFEREERFDSLPADAEAVKRYIRERSRAWQ